VARSRFSTGKRASLGSTNRYPYRSLSAISTIDRLTSHFSYPSRLAEFADPLLPPHVTGQGLRTWFVRVFALRRGGAIIPHVHNHMVSAHLVVSGSFHVRTHDRVRDLAVAPRLTFEQCAKKYA
jgi:hypothetical protein